MNVKKEAQRDAHELARAQMFFGEGAGTRRKLIQATVQEKADRDPEYARLVMREIDDQDMAEHAAAARKERRRIDQKESAKKNTRALVSGNYHNVQSGILLAIVAGYFAHEKGLDKIAYEKGKVVVTDVKIRIKKYRNKKRLNSVN